jgi:septal ring factor EnvC (AmiA/AmiB activator)
MNESNETFVLLYTQFLNGQINMQEFSLSMDAEREKEEKKFKIIQNNLRVQQDLIDKYISDIYMKTKEIEELTNKLTSMTADRDNWKEEYDKLEKEKTKCLPGLRKLLMNLRK